MKRLTAYIVILLSVLFLMPSCIEEYHGEWETENAEVLVVSGSIKGESLCTFILRRSTPIDNSVYTDDWHNAYDDFFSGLSGSYIDDDSYYSHTFVAAQNNYVRGAKVTVESVNGALYECKETSDGRYSVYVDKLNPDEEYFLRMIMPNEEEYTSTPMKPLDSPEIVSAGWKREGTDVQLNITTEDLHEPTYFTWDYLDIWEIRTPMVASVEYDPRQDAIVDLPIGGLKNRGWISVAQHSRLTTDNKNYGYGALKKFPLYRIYKNDQRFQVKYYTKIRQMAITREEYEYNNLILLYNSQMGGLFTPMPSELPTNIRSAKGKRGVGYVGVRGKISQAEICIGREQVGCDYYVKGEVIPDDWIAGLSKLDIYNRGYRVYSHDAFLGLTTWTYPYCIDVTSWGASLVKPEFWDYLELTPEDGEEY